LPLVVEIHVSGLIHAAVGGQFFLSYDPNLLEFVSIDPGDAPFLREVYENVDEISGTIDYAVGVNDGDVGTLIPTTMARITFQPLAEFCAESKLVTFRAAAPPTRVTDDIGVDLLDSTLDLTSVTHDQTPPTLDDPANYTVNADAGSCEATIDFIDPSFNGSADYETASLGYYYVLTGNQMDTRPGGLPNGDNADGGTMRYIHDHTGLWGATGFQDWSRDDWFEDTVGVALTLKNSGATVYTNTTLDAGDPSGEYDYGNLPVDSPSTDYPLLYRGYAMRNNYDWTYSGLFYLDAATTLDEIIGYFDLTSGFDPANSAISYRVNIWSAVQDGTSGGGVPHYMPGVDSFVGDVFSSSYANGNYSVEYTGVNRVLPGWLLDPIEPNTPVPDEIWQLRYELDSPITLQPGFYFFGHQAIIGGPDMPFAADECQTPTLDVMRSDSLALTDPFPAGTTTVTWLATDSCGNSTVQTQDITVEAENTFIADVALDGVEAGPFTRCITFELENDSGGTFEVEATVNFINGFGVASFEAPCDLYTCITARDKLHTLRRDDLDDFGIDGSVYVADFTDNSMSSGDNDTLLGGNFNDDGFIDILDFGVFIAQFNQNIGADTTCMTVGPHADASGDGIVQSEDFTFVQTQFLTAAEQDCATTFIASTNSPRTQVSLVELKANGLGRLSVADLNRDGWLDQYDIVAFLQGQRPGVSDDADTRPRSGDQQAVPAQRQSRELGAGTERTQADQMKR
jgi:hypothetical protein